MRGRIGRVKAGHPHGGHAPLGYRYVSAPHAGHWADAARAHARHRLYGAAGSSVGAGTTHAKPPEQRIPLAGRQTEGGGKWMIGVVTPLMTFVGPRVIVAGRMIPISPWSDPTRQFWSTRPTVPP